MLFLLIACSQPANEVVINRVDSGGYGYSIRLNNKIVIVQDNIPAISQNLPFRTENDARRVGEFVLSKLENNPNDFPDITPQMLDSLNISY